MLWPIIKKHRVWFCITYVLLTIEFVLFAAMPCLLGKTVDAMLGDRMQEFWVYMGLSTFAWFVGRGRRRLDARFFSKIWVEKSLDGIRKLAARHANPCNIINRVSQAQTFQTFFEFTAPAALCAFVEIAVATVMIIGIVPWQGCIVFGLAFLTAVSTYFFSFWVLRLERTANNLKEEAYRRIHNNDIEDIDQNYAAIRKNFVKQSDLEALNWSIVDVMKVASEVIVLFAVIATHQSVGMIMSTLAYTDKLYEKTCSIYHMFAHYRGMSIIHELMEKEDQCRG